MRIAQITPHENWILTITAADGRIGEFDVAPYLQYEAFEDLKNIAEFTKISNGGYFIEWDCGADLSTETVEARWKVIENVPDNELSIHETH